ncbi:HlyD family type I secretion periplasmic adaptor subunit [Pelagibius litoralis]|uniref:Membrane fusion protein (MFP) family protein n=1 Tax=Pelagibius litoralis TaxID=374515 RepID=A0A967CAJ2_9PROT|nr:HlyD family type I secretion periplasmic adaptor subunit [Pelagibius litoralis]NIA67454.1 HlyD family type I secretion periplasmic adaptor subunit [Pelagibius litoralis]
MNQPRPAAPTGSRTVILAGLAVLALTFGGFFGWAATAELSSAVIASGKVTVDSNRKSLQHMEGGIVSQILVRNGDAVRKDELLLRLDETRARASLSILQAKLDENRANEARLRAERNDTETITFPDDLMARASIPQLGDSLRGQQSLFAARRETLKGEIEIHRERIVQVGEQIHGLTAQQNAKARQIDLIGEELNGLKKLLAKGFAEKNKVLALEREAARLGGERGEHIAEIAAAKTAISQAELEILQLRKDTREAVEVELRQVRTEIFDLRERVLASQFVLDHLEVRAPEDGIIVGLAVHAPGQVVQPGATILELVPVDDELIVEARVQPFDIDNLSLGLPADVIFTAFPQRTTPKLQGTVAYFSADRFEDERSGEAYYLARIAISEQEAARLGKDQILRPGMPADVMIKTGARTALDYLVQPLTESVTRAWREN